MSSAIADGARKDESRKPDLYMHIAKNRRSSHSDPSRDANAPLLSPSIATTSRSRFGTSDLAGHPHQNGVEYLDGTFSSWSQSSDKQLGYASPGGDRVFPIRSVVSVDPTQTPLNAPGQNSREHDGFPGFLPSGSAGVDTSGHGRASARSTSQGSDRQVRVPRKSQDGLPPDVDGRHQRHGSASASSNFRGVQMGMFDDSASEKSTKSSTKASLKNERSGQSKAPSSTEGAERPIESLITARFKHIVTEDGHAIVTGRGGETLQRCEDEPIHIPGAVQSFGLLVALSEQPDGQLEVRIVSENSKRIIGYTPEELFKLKSFTDILSEDQTDNLLDHVDFIRDEEADPASTGPEVFTLSVRPPKGRTIKLWCGMHVNPTDTDLIICEFELDEDLEYPLSPPNDGPPEPAEDTLDSNPTEEDFLESTQNSSKPLRVLRSARKRKGEAAAMEVFNIMSQVQEQLANATNLELFLKILVGIVRELTGFHRVMIYQFDSVFNGRVVTELVDPAATKDLYKGLNFPASDIPKQARELYKVNKVRLLYDRDLETARLVCRTVADLEEPLDLSFSYLRAMSPIHIKYLRNMAVRSSMSISINAFGELWGLIACHGYGARGMRVTFPIRKMCRLIGDTASRNIERLSYASRLQARKLINTVPTTNNPSGYIIASSDDLLKLFDADFGLLSIKGETKILGGLDGSQEALAMLEYLRLRTITSVTTSQDVLADFPDLRYDPGFQVIAGLLLVPLSAAGADFIVFFRRGQVKEVKWAGNPYEKFVKAGTEGFLEPRKSFKTWSETVVGKCREWTEEQVETAAVLCLVYGKFIEVWRQKEAAVQSSHVTRLLLSNSAHEVRTPLNAIINYLEIALEGSLDQETRENLAKSHSASKSLIYVINDLLDLTKTEEGKELIKAEIFDLPGTIREATAVFNGDARRKGLEYEVSIHDDMPQLVYGDQRRLRQAVSNVVANAMQSTSAGGVKVDLYLTERDEDKVVVELAVQDTGCGMSDKQLDNLFRDLEQVSEDDDMNVFPSDEDTKKVKDRKDDRILGLGLAVVARVVRNMNGQLRLKSEEGKGSRFVLQVMFDLPEVPEESIRSDDTVTNSNQSSLKRSQSHPTVPWDGEVLLVDQTNSSKGEVMGRKRSTGDIASLRSYISGSGSAKSQKSDVDRLIDAISEPLRQTESSDAGSNKSAAWSNSHGSLRGHDSVSGHGSLAGSSKAVQKSADLGKGNGNGGGENTVTVTDRPLVTSRSDSSSHNDVLEHLRSASTKSTGYRYLEGSRTALKPVRMPDEFSDDHQMRQHTALPSSAAAGTASSVSAPRKTSLPSSVPANLTADHLQVLVAEDDPINSKIIIKRLSKSGHEVHHTVNGEDCASAYGERLGFFDVVLMDMQMPIVDGLTSTKMIRSHEKTHGTESLSTRAKRNGRVPVFAVSASLVERDRQMYIDAGFDGWILKPIDFNRLNILLNGIVDARVKQDCLYQPGRWERGGWFPKRRGSVVAADTTPREHQIGRRRSGVEHASTTTEGFNEGTTPMQNPKRIFCDERNEDSPTALDISADVQASAKLA